jgi:hypothetical protein
MLNWFLLLAPIALLGRMPTIGRPLQNVTLFNQARISLQLGTGNPLILQTNPEETQITPNYPILRLQSSLVNPVGGNQQPGGLLKSIAYHEITSLRR